MDRKRVILYVLAGNDKEFQLEQRVFNVIALFGVILSAVGVFINIALTLDWVMIFAPAFLLIFTSILYYQSRFKHKYVGASYLSQIVLIFIFYPVIWFFNGGKTGSATIFIMFNALITAILLNDKKQKKVFWSLNIGMIFILILIEVLHPEYINSYATRYSRFADIGFSFIVLAFFTTVLIQRVMGEYFRAIRKLEGTKENLQQNTEALRIKSVTDEMTGLFNRRYVMTRLNDEIQTDIKQGTVSVIMFDIDNFKKVNDQFGHAVGDEVIKKIGRILSEHVRKTDIVGRIGGEEYLVLLPRTSALEAETVAIKLRDLIGQLKWSSETLQVTVSAGVYSSKPFDSLKDVFNQVDQCLYYAKNNGRNLVCLGERCS